jgi:predicted porin
MQKKLIVLAIAALASTSAFADTTVYGVADAAITSIGKTGMKTDLNVTSGGLSTSRLGVKAVEDLDNGMKVIAVLEYKLDIANNAAPGVSTGAAGTQTDAARQQMLALAGGFGTVAAGYLQTTGYDFSNMFDPTAGSAVSSANSVNPSTLINMSARAPHAAAYISPNMGGVSFAYNHSFDVANTGMVASTTATTAGNKTTADLFSVTYAAGPLAVGGVYAATSNEGTGFNKTTDMAFGASYDLTVVKLLASYVSTKTEGGLDADTAMAFHAVAPVTATGTVVASFGKNTIGSTAASDNTSAMTVAYLEGLSKTTTAYAAFEKVSKDGTTTTDTNVFAVGLRKKF